MTVHCFLKTTQPNDHAMFDTRHTYRMLADSQVCIEPIDEANLECDAPLLYVYNTKPSDALYDCLPTVKLIETIAPALRHHYSAIVLVIDVRFPQLE